MIKEIAWNTFKNTGSINSFLELVEVENLEKDIVNTSKSINSKSNINSKKINLK